MINRLMVLVAFLLMPLLFSTGAASARDLSLKEILPRNFAYYLKIAVNQKLLRQLLEIKV